MTFFHLIGLNSGNEFEIAREVERRGKAITVLLFAGNLRERRQRAHSVTELPFRSGCAATAYIINERGVGYRMARPDDA